jgi:hypothetical protein
VDVGFAECDVGWCEPVLEFPSGLTGLAGTDVRLFDIQTQESQRSHVPTTDVCLAHVLSNTYAQFQSPEEWQYVLYTQVCFTRNGYLGMPVGMCCNEMDCGID